MIYFFSDPHFDDQNCADKRGMTVEESNFILLQSLSVVTKREKIFVLGDVGHNKKQSALLHWDSVKGTKHLIMGNHDQCPIACYSRHFDKISGVIKYKNFVLSHIPLHPDDLRGRINIHGHKHNSDVMYRPRLGRKRKDPRYINVNCDRTGLKPVSLDDILSSIDYEELYKFNNFKNWHWK